MELSENFHSWNVGCSPNYTPSAFENIESFDLIPICLICIGAIFSIMTFYFAIDATCNVFAQKETNLYKSNIISIFSVYPMASICSLITIAVPRAQLLSDSLIQMFLTVSLYRVFLLLIDVGRRKIEKAPPLMLRVGPCCCWPCCPCPNLEMTDSRLAWIRLLILQLPIVQAILFFILLVMAADENSVQPAYADWFQPFFVISILIAVYGLTMTSKSLSAVAPDAKLRLKTLVSQLVLLFSKFQALIIRFLIYSGIFPCRPPWTPRIYANVTQSTLMLVEMLLLCIAARYLYYVDLKKKEDFSTTDRSKDKPHSLRNRNDLPEQGSSKIAVVSIS